MHINTHNGVPPCAAPTGCGKGASWHVIAEVVCYRGFSCLAAGAFCAGNLGGRYQRQLSMRSVLNTCVCWCLLSVTCRPLFPPAAWQRVCNAAEGGAPAVSPAPQSQQAGARPATSRRQRTQEEGEWPADRRAGAAAVLQLKVVAGCVLHVAPMPYHHLAACRYAWPQSIGMCGRRRPWGSYVLCHYSSAFQVLTAHPHSQSSVAPAVIVLLCGPAVHQLLQLGQAAGDAA